MASGRYGPPNIKGTLGTLLRTTLEQVGTLREAVERQARSQRGWFDSALLERQRRDVLASLGELVYELAASGELGDLEEFPELQRAIADLEEIDHQIADNGESQRLEARASARSGRASFGRRGGRRPRPGGPVRVWNPFSAEAEADAEANPDTEEEMDAVDPPTVPERPRGRRAARRRGRRPARSGGGGIAFIEDEAAGDSEDADLAAYMHEDDVQDGAGGKPDKDEK